VRIIIIVWVKAWSSKCLVAAVGVASGNISRSLRPEELQPKDPKKKGNSKGKQIRSVVCVFEEREREPMLESSVKRCRRRRGL